jgi:hypothetical protein
VRFERVRVEEEEALRDASPTAGMRSGKKTCCTSSARQGRTNLAVAAADRGERVA